jgi:ABC-type transport system involved in cytochrome bd biosynthesis fused ATPase/permease subunit
LTIKESIAFLSFLSHYPENGRVVEDGAHDQLVAKGGMYAELFALQAEGYRR